MKTLILVESPGKVESVTHYAEDAGLQDFKVMATKGHLLDLPAKGLSVDLDTLEPTEWAPKDEGAEKLLSRILDASKEAQEVIVATDEDREGEGIASYLWPLFPEGKRARTRFKNITPDGIKLGLQEKCSDLEWGLVEAFRARRVLDRIFGYPVSDMAARKVAIKGLSAGLVQSPALRLVVDRWKDWKAFQPTDFFTLRVKLQHTATDGTKREILAKVLRGRELARFDTRAAAEALAFGQAVSCTMAEGEEVERKPRPPFTASTFLRTAPKALGVTVAQAENAKQALYDAGKTTYPRPDSVRSDPGAIAWVRESIAKRFGAEFVPAEPHVYKDKPGVQGAHEALRPAGPDTTVEGENAEAFRLIEARFYASQMAAQRVKKTTIQFQAPEGYILQVEGEVELFPGWRKAFQSDVSEDETPDTDDDQAEGESLPPVAVGETLEVLGVTVEASKTKPPSLFTQPSLVGALEELEIGRPATFKSMVTLIVTKEYVKEEEPAKPKKTKKGEKPLPFLIPTESGLLLAEFLIAHFPDFVDYGFRVKMEDGLDKVEKGSLTRQAFLKAMWGRISASLDAAQASQGREQARKEFGPCPKCATEGRDGRLVLKKGKKKDSQETFEFAGCSLDTKDARPCGYRADTSNGELRAAQPCPSCKKPMKAVEKKDKSHSWVCEEHGWQVADQAWKLITPPKCPDCVKPMKHGQKKDGGDYFWGCFEHHKFHDSDKWGKVIKDKPKKGK